MATFEDFHNTNDFRVFFKMVIELIITQDKHP